ncbi:MAG: ribbon-helix-helix protein, CopG family [Vicinamibacterales bacterium]
MSLNRDSERQAKHEIDHGTTVRATISFPADHYATLEEIARQKKVSLAWVVREAVDTYLDNKWPLFPQRVSREE